MFTNNGEKQELLEEQIDDVLVIGPVAFTKIE